MVDDKEYQFIICQLREIAKATESHSQAINDLRLEIRRFGEQLNDIVANQCDLVCVKKGIYERPCEGYDFNFDCNDCKLPCDQWKRYMKLKQKKQVDQAEYIDREVKKIVKKHELCVTGGESDKGH
jgi:hypothetical protein